MLTNAHTHLELGALSDCCPDKGGMDFVPWSQALNDRWRKATGSGCYAHAIFHQAVVDGMRTLIDSGATHVADVSATGASIGPLLDSHLQGVVYIEVSGLYAEQAERTLNGVRYLVDEWRPKERADMRIGLALQSAYTVHPALWKKTLDYARSEALPLCIHAAESRAEYDYLLRGAGPLAEQRDYLGVSFPIPRKSPIQFLDDVGALELGPLLIDPIEVDETDIERIRASGSQIVYCPRSSARLRCARLPLEAYLARGVTVYLGTESLASSPSLDVKEDFEAAVVMQSGHISRESLEALVRKPLQL